MLARSLKIELRRIEHLERNSEETNCYAAQVWVNGKHMVDVSNDGHGGCDYQYPAKGYTYEDIEALNKRIAAEFPPAFIFDGNPHPADLETVCSNYLTDWLIERDIKKMLKRAVCFTLKSKKGVFSISLKHKGRIYTPEFITHEIKRRHGGDVDQIINDLPLADAIALWKKAE